MAPSQSPDFNCISNHMIPEESHVYLHVHVFSSLFFSHKCVCFWMFSDSWSHLPVLFLMFLLPASSHVSITPDTRGSSAGVLPGSESQITALVHAYAHGHPYPKCYLSDRSPGSRIQSLTLIQCLHLQQQQPHRTTRFTSWPHVTGILGMTYHLTGDSLAYLLDQKWLPEISYSR